MSACLVHTDLVDLLADNLAPAALDAVENHLEMCASCRGRLEALANLEPSPDLDLFDSIARQSSSFGGSLDHPDGSPLSSTLGEVGLPLSRLSMQGPDRPVPLVELPGFTDLHKVGHGGMGVVYRARQRGLERTVALKVISEGMAPRGEARERFRREAVALARLRHPNVVRIFGVGEYRGFSFLAMEWVDGGDLAERLRGGLFSPRDVAALAVPLAQALQAAHDQGIIHRDLKPSNILLADVSGARSELTPSSYWAGLEPKVSDFGLAKLLEDDGSSTFSGTAIGTPFYMAPEQTGLLGSATQGPATDIYGLGAIMYEMLVGRPPFKADTRHETILQVVTSEVVAPRRFSKSIPRDLETICLKCLRREPSRRYASAAALADDLVRYLDGRPIQSRRVGTLEWGVRWCRRNQTVAALLAALIATLAVGFAGATLLWRRADATARAESRLRIKAQAEIAERDFEKAWQLTRDGDADQGQLWMAEALREAPVEHPELGRVARANLAGLQGHAFTLRAILEHRALIRDATFRPDGGAVLTGSGDGTARAWDAWTGRPLGPPLEHGDQVHCVAFSPDGRLAVTGGSDGKARLWDAASGRRMGPAAVHGGIIGSVAFSPDGRFFVTHGSDRTARLWQTVSGRPAALAAAPGAMPGPRLSPDGRLLVTGDNDGSVRLWDTTTGRPFRAPMHQRGGLNCASFSPDGRRIITGTASGVARIWDVAAGKPAWLPLHHGATVSRAVFSPDGTRVLTGSADGTARLWDAASGQPVGPALRHDDEVSQVTFSPDGRLILTASIDHTARLWDAATGRSVGSPLRHRLAVTVAEFSPDGRRILTAGEDGTARLWEIGSDTTGSTASMFVDHLAKNGSDSRIAEPRLRFDTAAFSADRARVLLGSTGSGVARLVETSTGQPVGPPMKHLWPTVFALAMSPDGERLATASCEHGFNIGGGSSTTCQIWDARTARPTTPLLPHTNWVSVLAFRPDGKVLASGDYSNAVQLWDVETGARLGPALSAGSIVLSLAFSPDGRMLAVGTAEIVHQVELWDLSAGKLRGDPVRFKHHVVALAFSPDGTRLAAGSMDSTVRLVDVATGQPVGDSLCHKDRVWSVGFSPDSRMLLTVNAGTPGNTAARLWDASSGLPRSPELAHPHSIVRGALAFAPDSKVFATGCDDGSVHLWDVGSARPIGPLRTLRGPVRAVAFDNRSRNLLAVDDRGDVRTWPVPEPGDESIDRLTGRLAVRSGLAIDAVREVTVLDPETWRQHTSKSGLYSQLVAPIDTDLAWHETCARDAEAMGDRYAARWHLMRLIAGRPEDGLLRARHAQVLLLTGDSATADAELTRALELGPRERILDWLVHRAHDLRAAEQPGAALRLLDHVRAARPDDWLTSVSRAEAFAALDRVADREHELDRAVEQGAPIPLLIGLAAERARAGQWHSAAELYDRAIARGTVPHGTWHQAAIAHLAIDDEAGYQAVCRAVRSRHPAAGLQPTVAAALARVCTLGPDGIGDDGKVQAWVENLRGSRRNDHTNRPREFLSTSGAHLYRAGRYREAIDTINERITAADDQAEFDDMAFLAMAYHRAGDVPRAREMIARLETFEPAGNRDHYWNGRAIIQLRREAEALVLDHAFPADPFAR